MKKLTVIIVAVIIAAADCKFDFLKKKKECKPIDVICKCGEGESNVTIAVQQCKVKNETDDKNCEPCNQPFIYQDLCQRFKHCKSCTKGMPKCLTCPKGRSGDLCSEEITLLENSKIVYPHKIRIPRASKNGEKTINRFPREADVCKLPAEPMKTNEIDCIVYPTRTNCTQKCVYGHTFDEGQVRYAHCDDDQNVWQPEGFKECQPFIPCNDVVLQHPGKVYCVSHMMNKKSWCEVQCFPYETFRKVNWQRTECNIDGTWSPRLPFCAKIDDSIELVPPPKRILHKIK